LVDLEEEGVAHLFINALFDAARVCHQQVVANNLNSVAHFFCHGDKTAKIVLVKRILDGHDRVVLGEVVIDFEKFQGSLDSVRSSVLHAQVVSLGIGIIELSSSAVKTDVNFTSVSRILNGFHNDFQSVVLVSNLGSTEAAFVTDQGGALAKHLNKEGLE